MPLVSIKLVYDKRYTGECQKKKKEKKYNSPLVNVLNASLKHGPARGDRFTLTPRQREEPLAARRPPRICGSIETKIARSASICICRRRLMIRNFLNDKYYVHAQGVSTKYSATTLEDRGKKKRRYLLHESAHPSIAAKLISVVSSGTR